MKAERGLNWSNEIVNTVSDFNLIKIEPSGK